jgi:hypothetical protein
VEESRPKEALVRAREPANKTILRKKRIVTIPRGLVDQMHLEEGEIWSLTWARDGRALFRFGREITPGEIHIIWEAIGTHAETYGRM